MTRSFLEDLIYYYMDSGRVFAKFTLLYGTAANVNTYNSAVPEEMKMGKNLCQQQEGFGESWEKERSGRVVTENKLGIFLSSRGRLWVTFEENRDNGGVRGDLCHVGGCPALAMGRGPGELPASWAQGPWV